MNDQEHIEEAKRVLDLLAGIELEHLTMMVSDPGYRGFFSRLNKHGMAFVMEADCEEAVVPRDEKHWGGET